jgi:hypothetical protein
MKDNLKRRIETFLQIRINKFPQVIGGLCEDALRAYPYQTLKRLRHRKGNRRVWIEEARFGSPSHHLQKMAFLKNRHRR